VAGGRALNDALAVAAVRRTTLWSRSVCGLALCCWGVGGRSPSDGQIATKPRRVVSGVGDRSPTVNVVPSRGVWGVEACCKGGGRPTPSSTFCSPTPNCHNLFLRHQPTIKWGRERIYTTILAIGTTRRGWKVEIVVIRGGKNER
jgi:hypothetical protein